MDLTYKAVVHHLEVLQQNNLVRKSDKKYNTMYTMSTLLDVNFEIFDEIENTFASQVIQLKN